MLGNYYAIDKSDEGVAACQEYFYNFVGGDDYSDDGDGYNKACRNEGTIMGMDLQTLFNEFGDVEMLEEIDFIEKVDNPGFIKESNNYNKEYKVRIWLNDDVIISDTNPNADYLSSNYSNYYASIKVKVRSSTEDREVPYSYMVDGPYINYELYNIIDSDESIKTISFMKLDKSVLESRYTNATRKADLTREEDAINRVYAFIENNELIIASDKLIVFPELCGGYFVGGWGADGIFGSLKYIETINFNNINTSRVRDFSEMFEGCSSLTSLDLSTWDMYNGEYYVAMFNCCSGLTTLDLSSFDTSNVVDISDMFAGCSGLTSLDLSSFDTSKVFSIKKAPFREL